ncbi:MAG: class I SAM-dependent methyltransferase, partial [Promethearchaeota archaeon]
RLYDGQNIPFKVHSFDTIILNDVLEHVPYHQMEGIVESLKKVIKPNGIIYISATNRYALLEPHTRIPLVTWLPRIFRQPIQQKFPIKTSYLISNIYPYTFKKLKSLCKRHSLEFTDFTSIYILHKFARLGYIGNRFLRLITQLFKKLKLLGILYYIAYKFSVIIFVCKVRE